MLRFRSQMPEEPEVVEPSERVYFWNLNYQVSEQQLTDYLSSYGVTSVIIPVQPTYGIRRKYVYHLGIAYAIFETVEQATIAIQELYNKTFMGRELKLRYHIPYVPRERQVTTRKDKKNTMAQQGTETDLLNPLDDNGNTTTRNNSMRKPNRKRRELSKDTVYCKSLPEGTTDTALREYFKEHNPKEIWIFKSVPVHKNKCLPTKNQSYTSALVTLNTKTPLRDVVKSVSKVKLNNKKMVVKPAFLSKIVEVQRVASLDRPNATLEEHIVTEDTVVRNTELYSEEATTNAPGVHVLERQDQNRTEANITVVDMVEEKIAPATKVVTNEKLVVERDPLHTMKVNNVPSLSI